MQQSAVSREAVWSSIAISPARASAMQVDLLLVVLEVATELEQTVASMLHYIDLESDSWMYIGVCLNLLAETHRQR